jgi:methylenetetrahydrofolate dehydrogenase (NADP+)/methenyltetrahydrofolate cyclohydrolase
MIIDGKQIALDIQEELKNKIDEDRLQLSLHIIVVGENPVIESFIKYKRLFADAIGVEFVEHRLDTDVTNIELLDTLRVISEVASGIVVQLPLPSHIDINKVLDSVPSELDIDGLSKDTKHITPVAGAIKEILEREDVNITDKNVLVIGKGRLVGEPVAELLKELGANVITVDKSIQHSELTKLAQQADIIVSGAGVPNLVTKDMVRDGVILLDAGTSTQSGNLVGDIALECGSKASIFAKTPGGIGPMTVALLFKNLVENV